MIISILPPSAWTTVRHKVVHHAINDSLSAACFIHTLGWLLLRRLRAHSAAAAHTGGGGGGGQFLADTPR